MLIKITWSNGRVEMCSAYQSIEALTRDYFGGEPLNGVSVESAEAPASIPEPEVLDVPRVKRKKPADA